MGRFNEWEKKTAQSFDPGKKLEQFHHLYKTGSLIGIKLNDAHDEHLKGLVEVENRLGKVGTRIKDKGKRKKN